MTYTKEDLVKIALELLAKEYTDDEDEHYTDSRNVLSWGMVCLLVELGVDESELDRLILNLPKNELYGESDA